VEHGKIKGEEYKGGNEYSPPLVGGVRGGGELLQFILIKRVFGGGRQKIPLKKGG